MLYVFLFQNDQDYLTDEEFIESSDDDVNPEEAQFMKKREKSAKRGRKCLWPKIAVTDLVDIILENEKYKTKLLLTNTKNVKNRVYYDQVITELKKRFEEWEEEFLYNVPQTRSKSKRCVSICRKAALTPRRKRVWTLVSKTLGSCLYHGQLPTRAIDRTSC